MAGSANMLMGGVVGPYMAGKSVLGAGLSFQEGRLDWLVLDTATGDPVQTATVPLNGGELDAPAPVLAERLKSLIAQVPTGVKGIHLSVPTAFMRMVDMPTLPPKEMAMALSSEAERYRVFDGTEAVVGFHTLPPVPFQAAGTDRMVFAALRDDRLGNWLQACKLAKLKVVSVDVTLSNLMRGLAATGVLDGIVQQAGEEAYWGVLMRGPRNLWIVLWQGTQLAELREVNMEMAGWQQLGGVGISEEDTHILYSDVLDEIRRTVQSRGPLVVWLTSAMPPDLNTFLQQQLGTSVQPAFAGAGLSALGMDLSCIGAAYKAATPYPFGLNFLESPAAVAAMNKAQAASAGPSAGPSPSATPSAGPSPMGGRLLSAGVVCCGMAVLAWVCLALYQALWLSKSLETVATQEATAQQQQVQLQAEAKALQDQFDARQYVVNLMDRVLHQNALYPYLLRDLRRLTPTPVWVSQLVAGPQFTVTGRAMAQAPVLAFAKQWDGLPYVSKMDIGFIRELRDEERGQVSYDFNLTGQSNPTKVELPQRPVLPAENDPKAMPHSPAQSESSKMSGAQAPTPSPFVGGRR